MNRRNLEYFIAVSREGSMAAAAEVLHLTQPALSQAIRLLEHELGTELFVRLPRGTRLTAAGQALLTPAKQILQGFAIAKTSVEAIRGLAGGSLEIVTMPGVLKDPLSQWLARFRQLAPKVLIRLHETENAEEIHSAIRNGDQELGFTALAEPAPDLSVTRVARQTIVALLPPGWSGDSRHSVSDAQLVEAGLIVGQHGTGRDILRRHSLAVGHECRAAIVVERRDTAVSLVLEGAGAALLPLAVARTAQRAGAVVRNLEPQIHRPIYLVERSGAQSPAAKAFTALIDDEHSGS